MRCVGDIVMGRTDGILSMVDDGGDGELLSRA